jgi:hypothetical protein
MVRNVAVLVLAATLVATAPAACGVTAGCKEELNAESAFAAFVREYERPYAADAVEYERRFAVFRVRTQPSGMVWSFICESIRMHTCFQWYLIRVGRVQASLSRHTLLNAAESAANGLAKWGVTKFADWTEEELAGRRLPCSRRA